MLAHFMLRFVESTAILLASANAPVKFSQACEQSPAIRLAIEIRSYVIIGERR